MDTYFFEIIESTENNFNFGVRRFVKNGRKSIHGHGWMKIYSVMVVFEAPTRMVGPGILNQDYKLSLCLFGYRTIQDLNELVSSEGLNFDFIRALIYFKIAASSQI